VELLLKDGHVSPGLSVIQQSCRMRFLKTTRLLLADDRVDPSADSNVALQYAAEYGHASVVELLLDDDRVVSSWGVNDALWCAQEAGHQLVVKVFSKVDPSRICGQY
jgi:hypothetical protein